MSDKSNSADALFAQVAALVTEQVREAEVSEREIAVPGPQGKWKVRVHHHQAGESWFRGGDPLDWKAADSGQWCGIVDWQFPILEFALPHADEEKMDAAEIAQWIVTSARKSFRDWDDTTYMCNWSRDVRVRLFSLANQRLAEAQLSES